MQVDIGDLDFQYFHSYFKDSIEGEKSTVCLPRLPVSLTREHHSMCKELTIDFNIDMESDGTTEPQKCFRFPMKLNKLISTGNTKSHLS